MTPKQAAVYEIVKRDLRDTGMAPTLKELGEELNISKITAREHLDRLVADGLVKREPNKARSLRLTGACPCCGAVRGKGDGR